MQTVLLATRRAIVIRNISSSVIKQFVLRFIQRFRQHYHPKFAIVEHCDGELHKTLLVRTTFSRFSLYLSLIWSAALIFQTLNMTTVYNRIIGM